MGRSIANQAPNKESHLIHLTQELLGSALKKNEQSQSSILLIQVGRVVTELANLDHVLGFVYGMLGEGPPGARWTEYEQIRSLDKRVKAVDGLVRQTCAPEPIAIWDQATGQLKEIRQFRNRVAHLGIRRLMTSDRKNLGVELRPPWYLPRANQKSLTEPEVREAANKIVVAKAKLWDFINSIAK